jgi:hypothetical protein
MIHGLIVVSLLGIDTDRTISLTFVIGAALAASRWSARNPRPLPRRQPPGPGHNA